jgi:hypothetical protein
MVYSVGPQLGASGIKDPDGYKQIYRDAFAEIGRWNKKYPNRQLQYFRITMLSTGVYAGVFDETALRALRQNAATLIVQAFKETAQADRSLAGITILINSNYKNNPPQEPAAFGGAAIALGVKPNATGFDLPL